MGLTHKPHQTGLVMKAGMVEQEIQQFIATEYSVRHKKWPDAKDGVLWAMTELAEVIELLMARDGGWTRNNPQNKPQFDLRALEEELGDVIWMCLVIAQGERVSPIQAMISKANRKLDEYYEAHPEEE